LAVSIANPNNELKSSETSYLLKLIKKASKFYNSKVGVNMKGNLALSIVVLLLISSCQPNTHDHTLRVSVTNWIGYTPLFYAKEKGLLDPIDVKLINVVSLNENVHLYKAGNSDAFGGTQYEHSILTAQVPDLVPIMLFDLSNGGDMVMSNQSISALQNSASQIDTYLEMDSINIIVLNDFIRKFKIDESRINFIDRDQNDISSMQNNSPNKPVIIVTYMPFDIQLKNNGFKEIISTKNGLDLVVLGAIFTQKEELDAHREQFMALKKTVDQAILSLNANPKEYYDTIAPYFVGVSYEEFLKELGNIVWIHQELDQALKTRLQESAFPLTELF
jgi:NitT/TauT family transport system substrate-binding protein